MLTDEEKARIRHHLGYVNVGQVETFHLGIPAAIQTTFLTEGSWDKILPAAENIVRKALCRLDEIEEAVFSGLDLADVLKTGDTEINQKRLSELVKYYKLAQQTISNVIGVPPNAFDMREWLQGGGVNVSVRN